MLSMEEMQSGRMGRMFERHDTDGDGAISDAEFEAMAKMRAERMSQAHDGKGHGMKGHHKEGRDMKGHGHRGYHEEGHGGHSRGGGVNEIHYHTHHHYYSGQGDARGMDRDDHMRRGQPD